MTKTNFNIKTIRDKQVTVSTLLARCIFVNLSSKNALNNPYYYGKNGNLRGWIVGSMVQGSKLYHRDSSGKFKA